MKRLILLCLLLLLLRAEAQAWMNPWIAGSSAPVASCNSITVDTWETFEIASLTSENLDGADNSSGITWAVSDASSKLSISTDGEVATRSCFGGVADTGEKGLAWDSTDNTVASIKAAFTASGNVSVGFWWKSPAGALNHFGGTIATFNNSTTQWCSIRGYPSNPFQLYIIDGGGGTSAKITITQNTWYWVSVNRPKGLPATLSVYDSDGALVGSEDTPSNTQNTDIDNIQIGFLATGGGSGYTGSMYFDDLVIDWTNHADPLGP